MKYTKTEPGSKAVVTTGYVGDYFEISVGQPRPGTPGTPNCALPRRCAFVALVSSGIVLYPGQAWYSYYFAGASRIALRIKSNQLNLNDGVFYFLSDHLGGTALTLDANGAKTAELRYTAWGETRYISGSTPTQRRYTGQLEAGLYFYNARWYDPSLGRFAQADTLIPDLAKSQSWDRYAYTSGNPINRVDPDGHEDTEDCRNCGGPAGGAGGSIGSVENRIPAAQQRTVAQDLKKWYADPKNRVYAERAGMVPKEEIPLYRSMKIGKDGKPVIEPSSRGLGVRTPPIKPADIVPDASASKTVYPETGGMSVSPNTPKNLPSHKLPPSLGGTSKDPVWCISSCDLGPKLRLNQNSPTHGYIEPAYPMSLQEYEQALASTVNSWRLVIPK